MQNAMNALNPVMTVGQQMRDACKAHSAMSNDEIASRSAEVYASCPSIRSISTVSPPTFWRHAPARHDRDVASLYARPHRDGRAHLGPRRRGQRSLMRQIKELQNRLGFAVIFVTHDISLVRHFSDRLMVMYRAGIELGVTSTLFEHLATPTLAPA